MSELRSGSLNAAILSHDSPQKNTYVRGNPPAGLRVKTERQIEEETEDQTITNGTKRMNRNLVRMSERM